jgi:hypothetical protein
MVVPNGSGTFDLRELFWKTSHVGLEVLPNPFRGRVLALHPLNWIVLARHELREQVGRCISSPQFDDVMRTGRVADFAEYWQMIGAILSAAHLYRQANLEYESRRGIREPKRLQLPSCIELPARCEGAPEALLRDFVAALNRRCPCGGTYQYVASDLPSGYEDRVDVPVVCRHCNLVGAIKVSRNELERFLRRDF